MRVQRTILAECWKPTFALNQVPRYTELRREIVRHLRLHNHDRAHNRRHTGGRTPAEILHAAKMFP